MDEIQDQWVLAALVKELGNKQAKKIFHKVFKVHEPEMAFIALEKGDGGSSLNQKQEKVLAPIVEPLGKNVMLSIDKKWEMDIGIETD